MEELYNKVQNKDWDGALTILDNLFNSEDKIDTNTSILGATVMEYHSRWDSMYSLILNGLNQSQDNYELYLLLGNYYSRINPDQAFLCYENALYLSIVQTGENSEDSLQLKEIVEDFRRREDVHVNNVSIVILSYNTLDKTKLCINSIRAYCYWDTYEIIVVENASTDGSAEWLREQKDLILIENSQNSGFPAGCNQGIRAADKNNDIFLLNSDTMMMSNSLYLLRMGLYAEEKIGASGAVTNYSGNQQIIRNDFKDLQEAVSFAKENNIPRNNAYEMKTMLIMFAMLIKRKALNEVGELDERFTPGNYEDDDYGVRLMQKGYICYLCWNCYIHHFGSQSFRKDPDKYYNLLALNEAKLKEKWDFNPSYFKHSRYEIVDMIKDTEPSSNNNSFSVLEIGCGLGETLARIKYLYPNADVHGIEIAEKVASLGAKRLDIICADIEKYNIGNDLEYDYIIFADVLEHLRDPETILIRMKEHLKPNGYILASILNIMNARIIYDLLHGDFTYQDAGILDRTHLKFFTKNEIIRMFKRTGFTIDNMIGISTESESTKAFSDFFDRLLDIPGVEDRSFFDVYQYIVRVKNN